MTGCPNGCARPYMGDIGLIGCCKGLYHCLAFHHVSECVWSNCISASLIVTTEPIMVSAGADNPAVTASVAMVARVPVTTRC
jgi:dissimilatory sulfite reductase (desulfoviridin) alpha/beta subunit